MIKDATILSDRKNEDLSFCLFRIPDNGGRVLWQITNTCNYTCSYCIFSSGPEKFPGELTTAAALRVIEELRRRGFTYIKFTGGEPFARRDLIPILRQADSLGIEMDVSTNASLIDTEVANQIASIRNLRMMHVSVDGASAVEHEAARGQATFEPTIRGLNCLVAAGIRVRVGCVVFRDNQHNLPGIAECCAGWGVDEVIFSIMEPVGRLAGRNEMLATRSTASISETGQALKSEYAGRLKVNFNNESGPKTGGSGICPAVRKFLFLDHLGRVSPCSWITEMRPEFLSKLTLASHSLDEIIASEPIRRYQALVSSGDLRGERGCPLAWISKS